jgi:hypothetical protein
MLAGKEGQHEWDKPYSLDPREPVVAAVEGGLIAPPSCRAVWGEHGDRLDAALAPDRQRCTWPDGWLQAQSDIGRAPGLAVAADQGRRLHVTGLVAELGERGLEVDYRSVWEFVHAEKPSFKKSVVAGERDRPDVARRRAQWTNYQDRIAPARLIFIDETWTKTNMAPLRGWAPRGRRLIAKVPHGRWKTTRLSPPCATIGSRLYGWSMVPSMARAFETMSRTFSFRYFAQGTSSSWTISAAIRAKPCGRSFAPTGARLFFLPKYSPDLNPIEQVFAKQAPAAQNRRPNGRSCLRRERRAPRPFHRRRVRQLFQELRLRADLESSRFRCSL